MVQYAWRTAFSVTTRKVPWMETPLPPPITTPLMRDTCGLPRVAIM